VRLAAPAVRLSPDLDSVQSAINQAATAVLGCSKSLIDWGQEGEGPRVTFFDRITDISGRLKREVASKTARNKHIRRCLGELFDVATQQRMRVLKGRAEEGRGLLRSAGGGQPAAAGGSEVEPALAPGKGSAEPGEPVAGRTETPSPSPPSPAPAPAPASTPAPMMAAS